MAHLRHRLSQEIRGNDAYIEKNVTWLKDGEKSEFTTGRVGMFPPSLVGPTGGFPVVWSGWRREFTRRRIRGMAACLDYFTMEVDHGD